MTFAQSIGRSSRTPVMAGASLAALGLALAIARPAQAQSFNATYDPTFAAGSATITTGANSTTVSVTSAQTVIDWTPTDTAGTGTIDFQSAGSTATFQPGVSSGVGEFTVLNRIVPVDGTGTPVSRMIQFNGTVQSQAADPVGNPVSGGSVWFYSPNGIVVGPTARFNVGSLVLTTDPIDITGGLFGASGQIRFRGATGSTGRVQILSGAQITTQVDPVTSGDAYVAVVAPRIEQGGTINADGPAALVAAEQVDITINAGLFNIAVTQGTTDANGIVHTGSTGGPTTVASGGAPQVALVAVPKNDGMTMLLSGNLGYTPATAASAVGGSVVLSAGNGLGYDSTGSAATGNIAIGDTAFTSALTATASDAITVAPATLTEFQQAASLNALRTVNLTAAAGAKIDAQAATGLSLDVYAGDGMTGGTINVAASGGGTIGAASDMQLSTRGNGADVALSGFDGTGGTINLDIGNATFSTTGALTLDASGAGGQGTLLGGAGTGGTITIAASLGSISTGSLNLTADGSGGTGDNLGGIGRGGTMSFAASQAATVDFQTIFASANGYGGYSGKGTGGDGFGGTLNLAVSGNAALSALGFGPYIDANAYGGDGFGQGGAGHGGAVSIASTGGVLDFTTPSFGADGGGGGSDTSVGDGFGGSVLISLSGTDQNWFSLGATAYSSAGFFYGTTPGSGGGSATGDGINGVSLIVDGVSLNLANDLFLGANANGVVDGNASSLAKAGRANLSVINGGALSAPGGISVWANAYLGSGDSGVLAPAFTSALQGGSANVTLDGGAITTSHLEVLAQAFGSGADTFAGNATGGTASAIVTNGGSLTVNNAGQTPGPGELIVSALATNITDVFFIGGPFGGGIGSGAQGGTALLQLDSGQISTAGLVQVDGSAIGGPAGNGNDGGIGTGGSATLAINGGTFTPGTDLSVLAEGIGGEATGGGTGGAGIGGLAAIAMTGGAATLTGGNLLISADGGVPAFTVATAGNGDAVGGSATLAVSAGTFAVSGNAALLADGTVGTGTSGTPGTATAGFAGLSGGAIDIGGNLTVSALGDLARADGHGFNLQLAGSDIAVGGNTAIDTTGDIVFNLTGGTFSTAGLLSIATPASLSSTGLVAANGNTSVYADSGIGMTSLASGGTTLLQAISGPVAVSDLLSAGLVTALGQSVAIGSSAGLAVANAASTAGSLSLAAANDLVVDTAYASGALALTAGQTLALNGTASGATITATSADIAIAAAGQLGVRGTTATVSLFNSDSANLTYFSGAATSGGYSIDAAELTRIFADGSISLAVLPGAAVADMTVRDFSLAFGPTGNIGTNGSLFLDSPGRIVVTGIVALTTAGGAETFGVTARRFDIAADTGAVMMMNGAGALSGTIAVNADTFAVATSSVLARIDPVGDIVFTNALLSTPGVAASANTLFASSINANVVNGIFVQNLGASIAYADRRGFTADPFSITSASTATQIVINGVMFDANGNAFTGLDTASLIGINGIPATRAGRFNPYSTINGCFIGLNCQIYLIPQDTVQTKPDLHSGVVSNNPLGAVNLVFQPIELKETEANPFLPLVDEPVTGVGNEDLWGSRCDQDAKSCGGNER